MAKHKLSITLAVIAVAWYGFFGFLAPHYIYENPQGQAEVAADAMTAVSALMKIVVPWVALIIAGQAIAVYLRERRRR